MLRGRLHNVAIVVARTDAAARECPAESMQRGTAELTMQDALRAAQAEMRRAARNREAAMATGPVVGARYRDVEALDWRALSESAFGWASRCFRRSPSHLAGTNIGPDADADVNHARLRHAFVGSTSGSPH